MKSYTEPSSATDTSDVSNKAQMHVHASQKPYMLHAPAATLPSFASHQCTTPSAWFHTHAKPAAEVNTQYNQHAVQSSTEPMVPAQPSVPDTKVPASPASHT